MKVLAICGGNGMMLKPLRKYLVGNIELRSLFKTPEDIQWYSNFPGIPVYNNPKILPSWERFKDVDVVVGAPDCGHSSILSLSRIKTKTDPLENESVNLFFSGILVLSPKIWIMENLPAFLDAIPFKFLKNTFPDYTFKLIQGSVSEFGNSQKNR